MAALATPLLQRKKEPDEEQLLKLFWNRAELKKELAGLRREKEKLVEQMRQQDHASVRTQQRLEQLETLLADPLQAANAAVYYQLRGVWRHSRRQLQRLANELVERQQEREMQHALRIFEQERDAVLALLDEQLASVAQQVRAAQGELKDAEQRLAQLRGFWNYFRRRHLAEKIAKMQATSAGVQAQFASLEAERRDKSRVPPPAFAGLSLEGRRNINLVVIAMAQQLLVHFSAENVAALAREASVRTLADVRYGDVVACRGLSAGIDSVLAALGTGERLMAQVRRRVEFLRPGLRYARDSDTVPVVAGFGSVPLAIQESGPARALDARTLAVNVLGDEYWDLCGVLLA